MSIELVYFKETMSASESIQLTAVVGSVTLPGRLRRAVDEALARADGTHTELIDLAERQIPFADGRPATALGGDTAAVIAALGGADAVLLATPVYRGSLTGALKNLLDHVPVAALQGTPVALVAMGASDHHYLGAERHLRDVLAFFGAHPLPTAVYLSSRDFTDGQPSQRAEDALDAVISSAVTLAGALRQGPALGPVPLAAGF
jgi:FMN reductase